ncbi:hypothetical protein [Bradyrhizobium sp. STM 3809]|uniref:hypothetical protein n=1 Tax=Bradyrhizobium sp. STM 3809 TaxID=551936 RepID=UPI00024093D6|nr:hypothetical protein [Bradyrhizobium sp. STM 3809]CCE01719.1 conserved hypothetical protein [Bradyrhizobium sp. STM 3809]
MTRKPKQPLSDRVSRAAEAVLAREHSVSVVDVFCGLGWLDASLLQQWRRRQVGALEEVMRASPPSIGEAIALLRRWAEAKGLTPSETDYVAQTPRREVLRFSRSGKPDVETAYRTHFVAAELSEKARARLTEKASRAPELVVVVPTRDDWSCHRCGGTGDLLMMEEGGPACLSCAGLGGLVFLPSGNALLSRRAKARSARHAVVVRFSRTRGRYERQGLMVEPQVLADLRDETA